MNETVFFNLGNAIASDFDTKELERMAQIEHLKRERKGKFVIVNDPDNPNEEHILFDFFDQEPDSKNTRKFVVTKVIEKNQLEG